MGAKGHPPRKSGRKPGTGGISAPPPKESTDQTGPDGKAAKPVKGSTSQTAKPSASQPTKTSSKSKTEPEKTEEVKKPTTREIIAGGSWTGKLPMVLLYEHCHRQRWNRPQYNIRGNATNGFICSLTLSQWNAKTSSTTTLPPIRVPDSMTALATLPTPEEARHFVAAYALFRVCSMMNLHMTLPPNHRDLWKGVFSATKVQDEANGKAWLYDQDPFQTLLNREEEKVKRAKAAEEAAKKRQEKADANLAGSKPPLSKAWQAAPRIELGKGLRMEIERLVRRNGDWNNAGIQMNSRDRARQISRITALGFRPSHVEEAADICRDGHEMVEWLLINVPEDDLPNWALPDRYIAGLAKVGLDMKKEKTIQRLSQGGFSEELCESILDWADGSEQAAMEVLQHLFLDDDAADVDLGQVDRQAFGAELLAMAEEEWAEETEVLASIFGDRMTTEKSGRIEIRLEDAHETTVVVCPTADYPSVAPVLAIRSKLPAHIRLTVTRQALRHARSAYLGEAMVFTIVDWIEANLASIVANPGRLTVMSDSRESQTPVSSKDAPDSQGRQNQGQARGRGRGRNERPTRRLDHTVGSAASMRLLEATQAREKTNEQRKMLAVRQALPAWRTQDRIISAVDDCRVTIVCGETGSGKSTQAVQFILDEMISRRVGAGTNIICTQPRRIAAIGLAERVAAERCGPVGTEVGFAIRGEAKVGPETHISFVTTGVLLRRIQSGAGVDGVDDGLADVSHVVVDEVHERSVDTDFLLMLLRRALSRRKDLRLILMSATLDADLFHRYFADFGVGLVEIAGRTFPVTDYYLDDVIDMLGHSDGNTGALIREAGMGVNYSLISDLVEQIDKQLAARDDNGTILIFLSGTAEISRMIDSFRLPNLDPLPLHAGLQSSDQRRVFTSPPRGKRRVIAATNVAETSLTIPDVVAVIDTGRVKQPSFDAETGILRLADAWASLAAAKQRRGRAGRVRAGKCFKMFTRAAEMKHMDARPEPEMRRVPLEQLCLTVRAMGLSDIGAFLATALTPPDTVAVDSAVALLRTIGALDPHGALTALGRHLAAIPADLRCGKMMVYGALFGCLDACVDVAALLTVKSPFLTGPAQREGAKECRAGYSDDRSGDVIADLRAFQQYTEIGRNAIATGTPRSVGIRQCRAWCDQSFLSYQTLVDIASTKAQYITSLKDVGLIPADYHSRPDRQFPGSVAARLNENGGSVALVRSIIAAALHPQTARIDFPAKKFAAVAGGAVEVDPDARAIKYFARASILTEPLPAATDNAGSDITGLESATKNMTMTAQEAMSTQASTSTSGKEASTTRVFIHPSSTLFGASAFPYNSAFVTYWLKMQTSKLFIRDVTPISAFAVLLFAGDVTVDEHGRGLVVDGWIKVRAWARIAALVGRLRAWLDRVLGRWIGGGKGGHRGGDESEVAEERRLLVVVRKLVELGGMDI